MQKKLDSESANRIEWLFRGKLAAGAVIAGREWLQSYDKHSHSLYGLHTKALITNMVRVIETLALEPVGKNAATRAEGEKNEKD